jgi:hypothetical protein
MMTTPAEQHSAAWAFVLELKERWRGIARSVPELTPDDVLEVMSELGLVLVPAATGSNPASVAYLEAVARRTEAQTELGI